MNVNLNYLSFEDDVEGVGLCSFSNDDVFVLVFHLREAGHVFVFTLTLDKDGLEA